jgi:glycosyltransferase involved in cell wall biosynthesis
VRKVLFIVPSLAYGGTSKQFLLLAAGLPSLGFELRVAVLGNSVPPHDEALRASGIEVCQLGWKRLFDFGLSWRLRQIVAAFRPDVIHAWHLLSLRVLATTGATAASQLIASAPALGHQLPSSWYYLDRWLLQRADRIVAAGAAEAEHYRRQRIPERRIVEVPPGVAPPTIPVARADLCRALGIEDDARLIVCAGPLVPQKGFQDAIWTFAILRYLFDNLHLIFIGGGPDQHRLRQFVQATESQSHVHFLGYRPDASNLLGLGEVVWVPSRRFGGVNVALEAMSSGRPVVATRLPALAEIVTDGEAGFLIDPGDKVALARKTRSLLEDPKRGRQMGEAGRQRIERSFTAARLVDRFANLYEEVMRIQK